jgi:hypothetical protein
VSRGDPAVPEAIDDNRPMSESIESSAPVTLKKSDLNLVWLDCEMSGLDPEKERLLEIAVVVTGPDLTPRIDGPVLVIHQSDEVLDGMDAWNKGTHGRSGLIDKVKASTLDEAAAEKLLLEFIARYIPKQARPTLPGEVHAQARGVLPLPQSRCQHAEGTGQALEADGLRQLQEAAGAHRAGGRPRID